MPTTEVSVRLPNSISLWMPCAWCGTGVNDPGTHCGQVGQPSPEPVSRTRPPVTTMPISSTRLATRTGTQQGAARGRRGWARPGLRAEVGRSEDTHQGRSPQGSPCRGACGRELRSSGRSARRATVATARPDAPARAGGRRPAARARRPRAGRRRAHPRAARRPRSRHPPGSSVRGTMTPPRTSRATHSRLATASTRLGAQRARPSSRAARRRPSVPSTSEHRRARRSRPGRVPAQRQAQAADDDHLHGLDGEHGERPWRRAARRGRAACRRAAAARRTGGRSRSRWPGAVNAEEMTHRARTPGHGEVDPAAGAEAGGGGVRQADQDQRGQHERRPAAAPRCAAGSPVSKRAWASDPARGRWAAGAVVGARPRRVRREVGVLEAARRR